jgi:flagellar biosynthetic protein FliO
MNNFKKKNIVILSILALVGCLFLLASASSGSSGAAEVNSVNIKNQSTSNLQSASSSLSITDSNLFKNTGYNTSGNELFLKMLLSILIVAALGVAVVVLSRKVFPRISSLQGKKIRITETVYLGPRRSVHLLEVGDRQFLIGCTNENINTLAELTGTELRKEKALES